MLVTDRDLDPDASGGPSASTDEAETTDRAVTTDDDEAFEAASGGTVAEGRRGRLPRLWWVAGVLWGITVVAAIVIAALPSGYLVDAPGNAIDTSALVTVPESVKTYEHPGGFRMVTVSETARAAFGQAFRGWLDPDSDVYPRTDVLGDTPRADEQRYQLVLMKNAKLSAVYQAMAVLGKGAKMTGGGVFVDQIVADSPAQHRLNIGDTITAIDGETIFTVDDITRFMKTASPGQTVKITVDRLGVSSSKIVQVTLGKTRRDGKVAPFLGIYMETHPNYTFPFEVGFDTGDIGGPSAGLALTLSLIDRLSPTSLTHGKQIAVTGTIQPDGSVGPIGGIRQKVAAVAAAGVKYFLVPADNARDARAVAGSRVHIVSVATLDGALDALRRLPR